MKLLNVSAITVAAMLALAPSAGFSAILGVLGNFDVINDTGSTAHGFEIDLEGLHISDITDTFGGPGRGFPTGRGFNPATSVQRYGSPSFSEYTSGAIFGTKVTYMGLFSGSWDYGTPDVKTLPGGRFATPGDNCWSGGGLGYGAATPCDHFGVGTKKNATKTTYTWLTETAPNSAVLGKGVVNLPAPAWNVVAAPPPAPGLPLEAPRIVAQIQAPAPLPAPEPQFGEAIWVKVFTTELESPPRLEDLVGDNAVVKNANTETEWQLLQTDPGNPNSGQLESGYAAPVGPRAASILRRYEFYKFSGVYNPDDHQATFEAGFGDSLPGPNDVGDFIGAQNGAAILAIAAVPEPETYALLCAGLAIVVGLARRRPGKKR